MGFLSADRRRTTSNTTDNRIAATDQAVVTRGGQTGLGDSVFNQYLAEGASLGGIRTQGNKGTVNITTADPDLFNAALNAIGESQLNFTDALKDAREGTSGVLDTVLGKLTDLAESKQTEGESKRDRVIMWIALGLFAVVAIFFWRRR